MGITEYPGNKQFAFTILDDTDDATVENVKPLYDVLFNLGMRTTKTVWPMDCPEGSRLYFAGKTLQDKAYLGFVRELVQNGFELASHGATMESSTRERTSEGLSFIDQNFDTHFRLHCNHGENLENIYWGLDRYQSLPIRMTLRLVNRVLGLRKYYGQDNSSKYFWGDFCKERFKYVRNFTYHELDISRISPGRPYRVRSTPYVNYWFATADAPDVRAFNNLVTKDAVDRMIANRGFSIISTHLGKGFVRKGEVNREVKEILTYLSEQQGWFVPVSELLDFLMRERTGDGISPLSLMNIEAKHIMDRLVDRIQR